MAQRVQVVLEDDLDGGKADEAVAGPAATRPTSAPGPRTRGTRSASAAGSPPRSVRRITTPSNQLRTVPDTAALNGGVRDRPYSGHRAGFALGAQPRRAGTSCLSSGVVYL